jgi:hypothetical protein
MEIIPSHFTESKLPVTRLNSAGISMGSAAQ